MSKPGVELSQYYAERDARIDFNLKIAEMQYAQMERLGNRSFTILRDMLIGDWDKVSIQGIHDIVKQIGLTTDDEIIGLLQCRCLDDQLCPPCAVAKGLDDAMFFDNDNGDGKPTRYIGNEGE